MLLGHNVIFDALMLQHEIGRHQNDWQPPPLLDTLLLYATVQPQARNFGLDQAARKLRVSLAGRHTALGDALIALDLFYRLLPLLATLFVSRGTPMLTAGDELGRTQHGNNNAYAQDNATTWIDWTNADQSLATFVGALAAARRAHRSLSDDNFLSGKPVDSPMVTRPNVLLALNEPSLHKFISTVEPGGLVFFNGSSLPEGCHRDDVTFVVKPFTEIADGLGAPRAGNIVMLGAFLQTSGALSDEHVNRALRGLVKSERWIEIDRLALAKGHQLM